MSRDMLLSRREFAGLAPGAGSALALLSVAQPAGGGMYISLNGTLTGGKVGLPEFVRLAARTGFGGVDVNLQSAMKEGAEATRTLLSGLGLKAAACGAPVAATGDQDTFRKSMEGLDEAARFAAAIGCNRMTFIMPAGSDTPKDELRRILKARFTEVGAVLARYDVRLGFEFRASLQLRSASPYEFIWRMNEMLEFARECGPNLGLLLDSWHWYHAGATLDDIRKAGKSGIVTVHVSDSPKLAPEDVRDRPRLLAGEGVIDLVGFLRALREIGYTDGISPEPFGRIPPQMSPEEGAKLGLQSMLAVMREAGLAVG